MWAEERGREVCGDSPHAGDGSDAAGFIHTSPLCHGGSSARHAVSLVTTHALKVIGIFGLCISTRPKDCLQTHLRCLFLEKKGAQPASRLWEEVFFQRVMEDKNLDVSLVLLFKFKYTLHVF